MVLEILVLAIIIVFSFDFFNGFHDAANAIATIVATKVLTPVRAVAMAALGNFVGMVFITNAIAETIGKGIVETSIFVGAEFLHAIVIVLSGVIGAIAWDIITWWWGLPTSSSHALIGGLVGSTIAAGGIGAVLLPSAEGTARFFELTTIAFLAGVASVLALAIARKQSVSGGAIVLAGLFAGLIPSVVLARLLLKGLVQIVVFMVAAPFIGLVFAFLFTLVVMRVGRHTPPSKINHYFKRLQLLSSFFYSVTHGTNDAQKGMGIITLILIIAAIGPPWGPEVGQFHVPFWVIVGAHASISLGTLFGGWRIVRTMSQKVTALRAYQGFCAETGGGIALAGTALAGVPVSTTHVISSAIMGVGATRRLSAVRWGVARRIVWAWVLTIPASAAAAGVVYVVLKVALSL